MPKFKKGSQEAKDYMASLRTKRGKSKGSCPCGKSKKKCSCSGGSVAGGSANPNTPPLPPPTRPPPIITDFNPLQVELEHLLELLQTQLTPRRRTTIEARVEHLRKQLAGNPQSGEGIISDVVGAVKSGANKVGEYIGAVVMGRGENYPPKVRTLIEKFGSSKITSAELRRSPVQSVLTSAMNALTFGKFKKNMAQTPYDRLFHLQIVLTLENGSKLLLEKNEVINMELSPTMNKGTEVEPVKSFTSATLNDALEKTKASMGSKAYFDYNAENNNCQDFILSFLKSNGWGDASDYAFVKQDTKKLFKGLSGLAKTAYTLTELGERANVALTGKGADFSVAIAPEPDVAKRRDEGRRLQKDLETKQNLILEKKVRMVEDALRKVKNKKELEKVREKAKAIVNITPVEEDALKKQIEEVEKKFGVVIKPKPVAPPPVKQTSSSAMANFTDILKSKSKAKIVGKGAKKSKVAPLPTAEIYTTPPMGEVISAVPLELDPNDPIPASAYEGLNFQAVSERPLPLAIAKAPNTPYENYYLDREEKKTAKLLKQWNELRRDRQLFIDRNKIPDFWSGEITTNTDEYIMRIETYNEKMNKIKSEMDEIVNNLFYLFDENRVLYNGDAGGFQYTQEALFPRVMETRPMTTLGRFMRPSATIATIESAYTPASASTSASASADASTPDKPPAYDTRQFGDASRQAEEQLSEAQRQKKEMRTMSSEDVNMAGSGLKNYVVQSVIFKGDMFSVKQAQMWLKKHSYKVVKVDKTSNMLRFRQINPKKVEEMGFTEYRTKPLGNSGIELILAYKPSKMSGKGMRIHLKGHSRICGGRLKRSAYDAFEEEDPALEPEEYFFDDSSSSSSSSSDSESDSESEMDEEEQIQSILENVIEMSEETDDLLRLELEDINNGIVDYGDDLETLAIIAIIDEKRRKFLSIYDRLITLFNANPSVSLIGNIRAYLNDYVRSPIQPLVKPEDWEGGIVVSIDMKNHINKSGDKKQWKDLIGRSYANSRAS